MARFDGTKDADKVTGTSLQDEIMSQGGDDEIRAAEGDDVIFSSSGNDVVYGGDGNDYISTGTGNDFIDDGNGDDIVLAGEGDDYVMANGGNDNYQGGKGFDTLDFSAATEGFEIDISKGTASGVGVGSDTFSGFERYIIGDTWDVIKGSNRAEEIITGNGDNTVRSLGGADTLVGGQDSDTFVYQKSDLLDTAGNHLGVDVIKNYGGNDSFDISGLVAPGSYADLNEVVRFQNSDTGSMLQVKINDAFVDVAFVEGASFATDVNTMVEDRGFILA